MCNTTKMLREAKVKKMLSSKGTDTLQVSVDAGSSETRLHLWDQDPSANKDVLALSSGYSIVDENISSVRSQSDVVYDNLEVHIKDVTEDKKDKVFEDLTIVKGGLLEDLRTPVAKTSSNTGKALQDTTYINTVANIAIYHYMVSESCGAYNEKVKVDLTLAMPQEDITSNKRQEELKEKMSGTYEVELPRLNYAVTVVIRKNKILLVDEAQAALAFWRMRYKPTQDDLKGVLLIDAGGRSTDLSLMIKGRVLANGSYTGKFGGQKFVDLVISKYTNDTGADMPTKDMIYDALDTGLMQNGRSYIDISRYITEAKKEIAKSVVVDINSLLDVNELRMSQLNTVICTGRLFGVSVVDDEVKSESMIKYIGKDIMATSENTEVAMIAEDNVLVRGLSYVRAAFNMRNKK